MDAPSQTDAPSTQSNQRRDLDAPTPTPGGGESPLVEEELLVEEVSIDGMCGVY